jgi:hypothetical protein
VRLENVAAGLAGLVGRTASYSGVPAALSPRFRGPASGVPGAPPPNTIAKGVFNGCIRDRLLVGSRTAPSQDSRLQSGGGLRGTLPGG